MQPSHWLYSQPYLRPVSPTDREEPGQFSLSNSAYLTSNLVSPILRLYSAPNHPSWKPALSLISPLLSPESAQQNRAPCSLPLTSILSSLTLLLRYHQGIYTMREKISKKSNKKRKMYKDSMTNMQTKWWQVVTILISTKGQFIEKKKRNWRAKYRMRKK